MPETKVCTKCGAEKSVDAFNWRDRKKGTRNNTCKACHAAYRRQHYLENQARYQEMARRWGAQYEKEFVMRRRLYVYEYLLEHPCIDCGETDPSVLEFDHVRGKKVAAISVLTGYVVKMEKLIAEIDKCEVRCVNCHRRKTARERNYWIVRYLEDNT